LLASGGLVVLMLAAGGFHLLAQPVEQKNVSEEKTPAAESESQSAAKPAEEKVATLAGGCFWCVEAVYERMKGVNDVVSGYTGDESSPNPTYQQISAHTTNHAEACQIFYDPQQVTFEELLEVFFHVHDPTTLNRQGYDVGPQYRSAIFYADEEQKKVAETSIAKLDAAKEFRNPIVTEVTKLGTFWDAEEYHQDYFQRNPYAGYCRTTVVKKVKKFQNLFEDKVRKDGVATRREE
jgi:peptide-methionine (S)-S-oxide reductase